MQVPRCAWSFDDHFSFLCGESIFGLLFELLIPCHGAPRLVNTQAMFLGVIVQGATTAGHSKLGEYQFQFDTQSEYLLCRNRRSGSTWHCEQAAVARTVTFAGMKNSALKPLLSRLSSIQLAAVAVVKLLLQRQIAVVFYLTLFLEVDRHRWGYQRKYHVERYIWHHHGQCSVSSNLARCYILVPRMRIEYP
jgi:hypothetical protein